MLHLLDVGFDDDGSERDHRAGQLAGRCPAADAADQDGDHRQPDEIELADHTTRIGLGPGHF